MDKRGDDAPSPFYGRADGLSVQPDPPFYGRLRANGRSHKQALIACIGKLVSIINAIIKSGSNATLAAA